LTYPTFPLQLNIEERLGGETEQGPGLFIISCKRAAYKAISYPENDFLREKDTFFWAASL